MVGARGPAAPALLGPLPPPSPLRETAGGPGRAGPGRDRIETCSLAMALLYPTCSPRPCLPGPACCSLCTLLLQRPVAAMEQPLPLPLPLPLRGRRRHAMVAAGDAGYGAASTLPR